MERAQVAQISSGKHAGRGGWGALRVPSDSNDKFNAAEVLYRDKFDVFLTYLLEIKRCMDLHLVTDQDLSGLDYWLTKLATTRVPQDGQPADKTPGGPLVFEEFINKYYPGLRKPVESKALSDAHIPQAMGEPEPVTATQ